MQHFNMRTVLVFTTSLCFVINSAIGFPAIDQSSSDENYSEDQEYQYDQYDTDYDGNDADFNEEEVAANLHTPQIQTTSQTIVVDEGKTIRLPCEADKLGGIPVIWYKNNYQNTVAAGATVVNGDTRTTVEVSDTGSTLMIGVATPEDEGQYICEIGITEKPKIKHNVVIQTPPSVEIHTQNINVEKGDDVILSCKGQGSPAPTVKWTRVGKKMPDGSQFMEDEEITFKYVSRKHEGKYKCTASNGFGKDASKTIVVVVRYEPEIEVEEVFIHSQTGDKAELVCNVHAVPHPTVVWKKNGELVSDSTHANLKLNNYGHKHTLTIKSVKKEDFGEYSCSAKNTLGSHEQKLELSDVSNSTPKLNAQSNKSGREQEPHSDTVTDESGVASKSSLATLLLAFCLFFTLRN